MGYWILVQQVERDICLLYHQLSEYSFIMGDLYYGHVYCLPYWDFLNLKDIEPERRRFIREGCLVMILAMAWEQIDGAGAYLNDRLSACKVGLTHLERCLRQDEAEDEKTAKLLHAVRLAVECAAMDTGESHELVDLSHWVHDEYVKGYFRRIAADFDTNPYYRS